MKYKVTLFEDRHGVFMLDGRNRLDAMEKVGMETVRENAEGQPVLLVPCEYLKDKNPYQEVISKNIRRRHLTPEQVLEALAKVKGLWQRGWKPLGGYAYPRVPRAVKPHGRAQPLGVVAEYARDTGYTKRTVSKGLRNIAKREIAAGHITPEEVQERIPRKKTSEAEARREFNEWKKRPRWQWSDAEKRIDKMVDEEVKIAPHDRARNLIGRKLIALGQPLIETTVTEAEVVGRELIALGPPHRKSRTGKSRKSSTRKSRRLIFGDRRGYQLGIARESLSQVRTGIIEDRWKGQVQVLQRLSTVHRYLRVPREPARQHAR